MPELDPADRGPQPEGAPARNSTENPPTAEQPPIGGGSSTPTEQRRSLFPEVEERDRQQAEQKALDRVRQQLGTVKQEFVQTKAQEAAKQQITKETHGLPWWQRAGQAIRAVPSVFIEQKSTTGQRAQEYTRDYERREEIQKRLATTGLKEGEEKQLYAEMAELEAKLAKGQGVDLTEQEKRLFDELQSIIATKRGELDLEDQKLKDRAEAGKILEWVRAHPGWKTAGVITGGGLLAASVLPLAGLYGIAAAGIKGAVVGAAGGAVRREASVHDPRQWARETGLLFRDPGTGVERYRTDQELRSFSNQELSRAVGVIKNALEQGKVGGSRGEYMRVWSEYRRVNDLLVARSQEVAIDLENEEKGADQAQLVAVRDQVQAQMRATDNYDRLLRNAFSEQEWQTYQAMQAGKGKQIYGAAILGAGVGAAAGVVLSLATQHTPSMQETIDKYYDEHRMEIIGQRRLAGAKMEELAERGITSLGLNPDKFSDLVTGLSDKAPSEQLIQDAFKGNIDLRVQVLGQPFVEWLKDHNDWFQSLPRNVQVEVISHPDLVPLLLEQKGRAALVGAATGGMVIGALLIGSKERERLEESGKGKITTALKDSADRYGAVGKAEWEKVKQEVNTKKEAEEAKRKEEQQAREKQLQDATAWEEKRRREDREEPKRIEARQQERIDLLQVGQRFELTVKGRGERKSMRKEYRINSMGKNPQTGDMVAEMVADADKRLIPLTELIDPDMSAYRATFVGFAPPEIKPAQAPAQTGTKKESRQNPPRQEQAKTPQGKKYSEAEIAKLRGELSSLQLRDQKTFDQARRLRDAWRSQGLLASDRENVHHLAAREQQPNKALYDDLVAALDRANPSLGSEATPAAETTT